MGMQWVGAQRAGVHPFVGVCSGWVCAVGGCTVGRYTVGGCAVGRWAVSGVHPCADVHLWAL